MLPSLPTTPPALIDDAKVLVEHQRRRRAREGVLAFTEYTHPSWNTGSHHHLIAEQLDLVERGEIHRLAIHTPPRHGKTEIVAKRFPAYCLGRHPEWQIIYMTAAGQFAFDTGAEVRDILRDPAYKHVFPDVELREDAQAAGRWRTTKGGIYFAAGVSGQIVGRGANLALIDDPHSGREGADSERMRDVVHNRYTGDLLTRLMTPHAIVFIMTRWHEDDLAGRIMPPERDWIALDSSNRLFQAGEWRVIVLRAIENENTDDERALWPGNGKVGFPLERLCSIRAQFAEQGKMREWKAQYQQNPIVEDGGYIQRAWFENRWRRAPANGHVFIASDFALRDSSSKKDPDYTEHGVFSFAPDGRLYVIDWWSGQETPDVWTDALIELFKRYKPQTYFGEAGMIRRAVESTLRRKMNEARAFVHIEWVAPINDKSVRGRAFQAWAQAGRVVFPQQTPWADRIIDQCVGFPSLTHDDGFDVMSLICGVMDRLYAKYVPKPLPEAPRRDGYKVVSINQPLRKWRVV